MLNKKYDSNNVFAKIIRDEVPANKIYEDDKILAFHDVAPVAPIHALVVPKENYIDFADFTSNAPQAEISNFFLTVDKIAKSLDKEKKGYRIVSNIGETSGQTVFHFHVHIISGKQLKNL